ncbi:class I SAM-dependent methyltransferase [Saliniramus fredricksonii]|uniref:Methyltransferase domain-containing protein n=1 Tax=Saliniramus fredricksonii TaxID=1653334 RepID=A0ABY0K678_9HYPH|nr:Methyltransferase domain-containing protein [Saliniramus fredricksonii]
MADQGSEGLFSPFLKNQRIRAARPHLSGRVLDVGCGSGSLAELVEPDRYLGVEIDSASMTIARQLFPAHRFVGELPPPGENFDTVVALAVIEHVPHPGQFLCELAGRLADTAAARIVCTTPHPSLEWVHTIGARIGLFSRAANEEHETLLDRRALERVGREAGLTLATYQRFLGGANQLAVYARDRELQD